jgi:hypothetical protein
VGGDVRTVLGVLAAAFLTIWTVVGVLVAANIATIDQTLNQLGK